MRVFHGTNIVIERPRIINRFKTLDFGEGFYTTENENQAREFAVKVCLRRSPTLHTYEAGQLDKESVIKNFRIKKLYNQVVFCSELVLSNLTFITSYAVEV